MLRFLMQIMNDALKILQIFMRSTKRKKTSCLYWWNHSITGGILQGLGSNNLELQRKKNIIPPY